MSIVLDHQLREQISYQNAAFPIAYFHDELEQLPDRSGPLHWHPDFEIAAAKLAALDFQVDRDHLRLEPGDCIFVNGNVLHGIRQLSGTAPDPMPNIVFSGALIAAQNSAIYKRYIEPVQACSSLPYVMFRFQDPACQSIRRAIGEIFDCLADRRPCFEMIIQRDLNLIFEWLAVRFDDLAGKEASRVRIDTQVRMQQMMTYIYDHYPEKITLEDIARAASISRSEAGRCFQAYMSCSPIEALIRCRLQMAHAMLLNKGSSLLEISLACGFQSVNYFSRQFRRYYGCSPSRFLSGSR